MLGVPGKGLHKTRVMGFAMWDILGTIMIAYILSKYSGKTFWKTLLFMFILGQCLHLIFCVDTTFIKFLFN